MHCCKLTGVAVGFVGSGVEGEVGGGVGGEVGREVGGEVGDFVSPC